MNKQLIGFLLAILFVIGMTGEQISATSSTYKVKSGDTLWDIAEHNNVSVADLFSWNELHTAMIFPDQEIKIVSNIKTYVVQQGDTLSDIAEAHKVSVSEIKGWNAISGHLIFPGDELTIGGVNKVTQNTTAQKSSQQPQAASTPATEKKQAVSGPPAQSTVATEPKQASTAASGKEMTVTATAYTAYCTGCSGTTYTGINLRANPNQKVIAVDPSVIPLGSRVWVEGYGEAIAGDIGGAIKGNIIDVFLQHKQDAYNWGRRTVKIKILD